MQHELFSEMLKKSKSHSLTVKLFWRQTISYGGWISITGPEQRQPGVTIIYIMILLEVRIKDAHPKSLDTLINIGLQWIQYW